MSTTKSDRYIATLKKKFPELTKEESLLVIENLSELANLIVEGFIEKETNYDKEL